MAVLYLLAGGKPEAAGGGRRRGGATVRPMLIRGGPGGRPVAGAGRRAGPAAGGRAGRRGGRAAARRRRARRSWTPPGWWSAPGSSTCTCTCASPAGSTRRRSRAERARRRRAASPRWSRCRTPTRRSTTRRRWASCAPRGSAPAAPGSTPPGAITVGQKGEQLTEVGEMVEAGAVAITDDGRPVMQRGGDAAGAGVRAQPSTSPWRCTRRSWPSRAAASMNEGLIATRAGAHRHPERGRGRDDRARPAARASSPAGGCTCSTSPPAAGWR